MSDQAVRTGFDWDEDQEALLVASGQNPQVQNSEAPQNSALFRRIGLFALGSAFMLGLAYERDMFSQLRGGASMPFAFVDAIAPVQDIEALPPDLLIYDDRQARAFLRGLRIADMSTLQAYGNRMVADLEKADPEM